MAKTKEIITDPLSDNNPITVQMLGICSALAVTATMQTTLIMSVAVVFVLTVSNTVISLLRNVIPGNIRMIVQMIVIASLVIVVDMVLKSFAFEMSKALSVFVGLIITNCIVMGRAEAFAMQNGPKDSAYDGLGNGLGYAVILIIVGTFREILGAGTWMGFKVMPEAYLGNGLAVLAPGAFIIIGLIIWVQKQFLTKAFEDE